MAFISSVLAGVRNRIKLKCWTWNEANPDPQPYFISNLKTGRILITKGYQKTGFLQKFMKKKSQRPDLVSF
jgi:hypothetical protein